MGIPSSRYRLALHLVLVVCDTQGRAMLRRVHQSRVDRQLRRAVFPAHLIDQPDDLLPRVLILLPVRRFFICGWGGVFAGTDCKC